MSRQVVIVGCGKIGRALVEQYTRADVDVVVIDEDANKLDEVRDLSAVCLCGVPIDREVLERAGLGSADTVLCVSDSENLNVMVGQMAKQIFGVPEVMIRTFLPANTPVYEQMGLKVICVTQLFVDSIMQLSEEDRR